MSLIELIIYIGITGIIFFGTIFSVYSMMISAQQSHDRFISSQSVEI